MAESKHDPHELDGIVKELIHEVPDKNLRAWREWLRGEAEVGGDTLRQQFDEAKLDEKQSCGS